MVKKLPDIAKNCKIATINTQGQLECMELRSRMGGGGSFLERNYGLVYNILL